jgi:CDP-diacylglycerol--glycerol-3-phosphate 3-phosphatidyltransferase
MVSYNDVESLSFLTRTWKRVAEIVNTPNLLTFIRIFLIPTVVIAFYLPGKFGHTAAAAIFACACVTDWVDGFLARNLNQLTKFGAFLDPVADKLIVSVSLILIVAEIGRFYIAIPTLVIIGREIAISALREWMAEVGKRTSVAVSYIAKIKTLLQMLAVGMLLLYCPKCHDGYSYLIFGTIFLYLAAGMTLWTMYMYLKAAWSDLTNED